MSLSTNKKPFHIAIVGAGLVGSLLSIYLIRRGYSVTVFERRPDMRVNQLAGGRSINLALSARGIRALNEVGLGRQLKETAIPMNGRMIHSVEGGTKFLPYGDKGQYINSISRSHLNCVLIDEAEKEGVKFFFDHRCLDINLERTVITLQHGTETMHHSAMVIIGSDGAFSAVRGALQTSDRFEYSQSYIEHGYKELKIPAGKDGTFLMEKEALHIWPRESYMLIALPNLDGTFTCTLFFPFNGDPSFQSLDTPQKIKDFFNKNFPDAIRLMPTLVEDFSSNPASSLVTIKCFPWAKNNTLLIGDAAHGVVPFYGQGMNAGFEDCRVLSDLLNAHDDDWQTVLPEFQQLRKPDTDAIAQLALDNFVEMRDLVADASFQLRKKIEARLHELFPEKWIPLYSMVTFHDEIRYSEALRIGQRQKEIMDKVMCRSDIESTWPSLNFGEIVNQLSKPMSGISK